MIIVENLKVRIFEERSVYTLKEDINTFFSENIGAKIIKIGQSSTEGYTIMSYHYIPKEIVDNDNDNDNEVTNYNNL